LIVEDNALIALSLEHVLTDIGMTVAGIAATADEAVRLYKLRDPDLVVMDLRLSGSGDGVDAAQAIHALKPVPIIFITGSNDRASISRIEEDNPALILLKPVHPDTLTDEIARLMGPGA
jgi:DNA-binding NarL/FixJ family response regulator